MMAIETFGMLWSRPTLDDTFGTMTKLTFEKGKFTLTSRKSADEADAKSLSS